MNNQRRLTQLGLLDMAESLIAKARGLLIEDQLTCFHIKEAREWLDAAASIEQYTQDEYVAGMKEICPNAAGVKGE